MYKDPEQYKQYQKEYRKKNKSKFREYGKKWAENNPEQKKLSGHEYKMRNKEKQYWSRQWAKYGVSEADYNVMLKRQGFRCAICKIGIEEYGKRFDFDHLHVEGYEKMPPTQKRIYFRGLLCFNCNRGLGHFKDNTSNLEEARRYIYYGGKI